jgi:hypothetical protein
MFFYSVKPISKHIRYIRRWRNIKSEVYYSLNKMSKWTSKKEMVNRLLLFFERKCGRGSPYNDFVFLKIRTQNCVCGDLNLGG